MALTKEKIAKNTKRYYATLEKYGFFNDDLVELLGEDFIKAPASTREDYHNSFEGGLIEHLLRVAKYAININEVLPENLRVDATSLLKVALLHQIGKAKLYIPKNSDWHNKNGIFYDFNSDLISMKIGERSIYYITKCNLKLTELEYQAIISYDKDENDKQAKYHTDMLGVILRQANELAIIEEKNNS